MILARWKFKITVFEQIKFLKKLYNNDLPFKIEDINTLKQIMIEEKKKNLFLVQKVVGVQDLNLKVVGILVLLKQKMMYGFATNLVTQGKKDLPLRKEITIESLKIKGL